MKRKKKTAREREFEEDLERVGRDLPDADLIYVMTDSKEDPRVQALNRVLEAARKRKVN